MIRERSYCLDLDESARSCWSDSEDSYGGAVVAPHRAGCCVCCARVDSGGEIDRQFGNMLGVSPSLSEHGEHVAHGLLCLCLSLSRAPVLSVPFCPPTKSVGPAGTIMPCAKAGLLCSCGGSTGVGLVVMVPASRIKADPLTACLTAYPGQSVTRQDALWHKRVRAPNT
jgi:hypothetical protein